MEDARHLEILYFIDTHRNSNEVVETIFSKGSKFHLLLDSIYDGCEPYNTGESIVTSINGRFYDITGEVEVFIIPQLKGLYSTEEGLIEATEGIKIN